MTAERLREIAEMLDTALGAVRDEGTYGEPTTDELGMPDELRALAASMEVPTA